MNNFWRKWLLLLSPWFSRLQHACPPAGHIPCSNQAGPYWVGLLKPDVTAPMFSTCFLSVVKLYPPRPSLVQGPLVTQDGIRLQCRRPGFNPWARKIPWRRKWQPTPVFLPAEFHGQRSLVGYSPRGLKKSDMTEWLTLSFSGLSWVPKNKFNQRSEKIQKWRKIVKKIKY